MGAGTNAVVEGHGGTHRPRGAGRLRCHGDLHPLGRAHLPALRRRVKQMDPPCASSTSATSRPPPSRPRRTAKLTRRPGVAVLTAGRGHQRHQRHRPPPRSTARRSSCSAAGRRRPGGAPGSLQEFDHVPSWRRSPSGRPRSRRSTRCAPIVHDAGDDWRMTPHRGPVFVDFPLDVVFAAGDGRRAGRRPAPLRGAEPDPDDVAPGRRADRRRRAPGDHRRRRRVLGRRRGRAARRRRGAAGARRS